MGLLLLLKVSLLSKVFHSPSLTLFIIWQKESIRWPLKILVQETDKAFCHLPGFICCDSGKDMILAVNRMYLYDMTSSRHSLLEPLCMAERHYCVLCTMKDNSGNCILNISHGRVMHISECAFGDAPHSHP